MLAAGARLIAAASVPDPTWIAGVYDGADGDEVLALVSRRGSMKARGTTRQ